MAKHRFGRLVVKDIKRVLRGSEESRRDFKIFALTSGGIVAEKIAQGVPVASRSKISNPLAYSGLKGVPSLSASPRLASQSLIYGVFGS